jgi:Transposase IS66 family
VPSAHIRCKMTASLRATATRARATKPVRRRKMRSKRVRISLRRRAVGAAQQRIRALIWWFYADLKAYCAAPTTRRRSEMRARFDRIFCRRTGFVTLDRLLQRLYANKAELLMVLERPEIPLHTNGSERDIRSHVTKRKIRGGTHSDTGRDCRDAFLSLMHTCSKLGIAFWDYLGDRLGNRPQSVVPHLAELIRCRGQPA